MSWNVLLKTSALALCAAGAISGRGCYGGSGGGSHGSLWITIVSPSTTGSYTTDLTAIGIGGDVGGWTIFDPAPTITWRNDATGASGSTGQLVGTFATGQIALDPGSNTITVKAANGVQKSAQASIAVFRTTP